VKIVPCDLYVLSYTPLDLPLHVKLDIPLPYEYLILVPGKYEDRLLVFITRRDWLPACVIRLWARIDVGLVIKRNTRQLKIGG
jgi:hypothetical protein